MFEPIVILTLVRSAARTDGSDASLVDFPWGIQFYQFGIAGQINKARALS